MQLPFLGKCFANGFQLVAQKNEYFSPHSIVIRTAHGTQQAPERRRREKFVFDNFPADSLSGCIEQQVGRCRSLVVLASFLPLGSERATGY